MDESNSDVSDYLDGSDFPNDTSFKKNEVKFFKYPQEVADDFENLFKTKEGYDVIFYVGKELKEIHAHSLILRARSQYFRTATDWSVKENGKFIFKKPNISPQYFEIILRFIYCGEVNLTKLKGLDILNLLIAMDEFNIPTLITCVQNYLIEHQYKFLQQNPSEILETVYQRKNFTDLWNFCHEKICEKPEILFNSDKFTSLKAPLLELLLKRNDLSLNEIAIWDSLIKWCLAQNPSIQRDVKKWNKDEITIMEKTIYRFIPLIRFYHISSEDFLLKVYPYKVLLPEDLINNILTFHMAPNKQSNMNTQPPRSTIPPSETVAADVSGESSENSEYNYPVPPPKPKSREVNLYDKCDKRKSLKSRINDFFSKKPT
ncbi:BTB/POZ protein [Rhizophagus diaphanus]|nr:BTB/POZ protein [Rhizophagus diaphanus] [Rhizophagus sp. MUCL 43196]